jgi:hypothetical protein
MNIGISPRIRFHAALVVALLLSIPLQAHHSGIMFDATKQVTLKGTIKEFVFANPHVTILITVADDKGQAVDWSIEAASTQALVRSGWRKSSLKFGDSVTIVGRPLKDGRPGAQLVQVTLADGTELGRSGANF